MSKGKHRSALSRFERIELASEIYRRGGTPSDVARKVKVSRQTAYTYREIYEAQLVEKAAKNAHQLSNHPLNAQRMLDELEEARRLAFQEFQKADRKTKIQCPECEEDIIVQIPDPDVKAKFLGLILKAQQDRAKLLGALGVKADTLAAVAAVKFVQDAMLKWMMENLCQVDRDALAGFLMSPDMLPYMGQQSGVPILEGESWEEPIGLPA